MRVPTILLVLIFFCGLLAFDYSSASAAPYTILSSQHKFGIDSGKTDRQNSVKPQSKSSQIVILKKSKKLIKRRPDNYGKIVLSDDKLRKKISAKSAIIMDGVSGEVVYAHSPDVPAQPASTIKVLTGLISIDSLSDQDVVKVSRKASRMPRSKLYLRQGRKYSANHLINAVLLASANDASVALAEKIAGSEEVFAKLMTAKAKSFGARNTVCKSSSGLTKKGQKSTARDLAIIFNKAMENDLFAAKMSKRKIQSKGGGTVYSHNKALWRIDGTIGGKTGYTDAARRTYVGKFKREGVELVVAFLGSETLWSDTKKLVEYGFAKKKEMIAEARKNKFPASSIVRLGQNSLTKDTLLISTLR